MPYFQVFYIFFILSFLYIFWFCLAFVFSGFTFILYYEVLYFFLILGFCTYIFGYFRVFYIFHIFRFYYIFHILKFSIFSFTFMLFICFIFRISPTSFYRFSVSKMFYLPVCITEPTNIFLILAMLKDG